jgi:transposase InsO family protein
MMIHQAREKHKISMERFYSHMGISRQGAKQGIAAYQKEKEMMGEIEVLVKDYRLEKDRRAGSRSVFYNLGIKQLYSIGVTKFEGLMSRYGLCLLPLQTRIITTKSTLQSWNYRNLTSGLELQSINKLVVGDLTYINLGKARYYLFCLTDVYSGRIVGYSLSTRMRSEDAMVALNMWMILRGMQNLFLCIHHTDGGGQYFSKIYLKALRKLGVRVSVAKNCLQNGYAEQRNGLIKHHLIPTISSVKEKNLHQGIAQVIEYYNAERKQEALGWKSPVEFENYIATLGVRPTMQLYPRLD